MKLFLQTKNGADGLAMIGAMAELGLDMTALADVLASSGLPCHIETQKVTRGGLQGTAVCIQPRSMEAMDFQASRDIFERAPVEDTVRRGAIGSLNLLHSVFRDGSLPAVTVAVLLCVSFGAAELGKDGCLAGLLPWSLSGEGVEPGAAEILCGRPVTLVRGEARVTAAGAALWATLFSQAEPGQGAVSCRAKGAGFGTGSAACVEMMLLDEDGDRSQREGGDEEILQLETHIDHLTGEEIGCAIDVLSHTPGVLDTAWFSGIGKKNRPLGLLRVLCYPSDEERVGKALFRQTHTLGYRKARLQRTVLPRRLGKAPAGGDREVAAKYYEVDGVTYVRPESDALRKAAEAAGLGLPAMRFASLPTKREE